MFYQQYYFNDNIHFKLLRSLEGTDVFYNSCNYFLKTEVTEFNEIDLKTLDVHPIR